MPLQTPLYTLYEKYGAKTTDFGGWELPVRFSSIKEEHEAVRTKAGLFDVSHMGEAIVEGKDAEAFLQKMLTNNPASLENGKAMYTFLCNEQGGTIDDLLVYQLNEEKYFLVLNAANTSKDVDWLTEHAGPDVQIKDISKETALLALQGPAAEEILQTLTQTNLKEIKPFRFSEKTELAGCRVLASRTGYTGEDGFEIYCKAEDAAGIWETIMEAGGSHGLLPAGLGARDTLRFEAKLPLYGQELSDTISPLEAGMGFAVKLKDSREFIGKKALQKQKEAGVPRKLAGIEMIDKGIPRTGYTVFSPDSREVGFVTSGTQSPTLGKNVGLVLIEAAAAELGSEVIVDVRGKNKTAKVVPVPFYKKG